MSEPVTNVQIEDVLSSIRRLVAEGEKPRKVFSRPEVVESEPTVTTERFVLTPALRVAMRFDHKSEAEAKSEPEADMTSAPQEEMPVDTEAQEAPRATSTSKPLILEQASRLEVRVHDRMTETERASLEATIAELEAAMAFRPDNEWEPDGSEAKQMSGLAEAFAALEPEIEDAQEVEQERVVSLRPEPTEPTFRHARTPTVVEEDIADFGDDLRASEDDGMPIPDDLDETLATYIAGGTAMDRTEIHQMVVEAVRQELQGELGERISRNIRKLVHREIQRATKSNSYD